MATLSASVVDCYAVIPGNPPRVISAATAETDRTCRNRPNLMSGDRLAFNDAALLETARQLGLARAKSASAATWLAMIGCAAARDNLYGRKVSLAISSTSATESTAFMFERDGTDLGWKLTDPFWLPNSIPSCIATSVFAALKLDGLALGFPGGVHGFFSALDHALTLLAMNDVERSIIVVAEHSGVFSHELAERSAVRPSLLTGAFAIVLEPVRRARAECILERKFSASLLMAEPKGEGKDTGTRSRSTSLRAFEADVPASMVFRQRTARAASRIAETDFVIRETGESYCLVCGWRQ